MDYQIAKSELQSPPPRVSLSGVMVEAVAMVAIAVLLTVFL